MAESTKDKIKYSILKVIDVSGFKVLDPPVRLFFGEEPPKQIRDIMRYMVLPIIFCFACLALWTVIGPNHKTKSGEVPTPKKVWAAWGENSRFHEKENEKEGDFESAGDTRQERIAEVESLIKEQETDASTLMEESKRISAEAEKKTLEDIAPLQAEYDALKAQYSAAKDEREAALKVASEKFVAKEISSEEFIKQVEANELQTDAEKKELKGIKTKIDDIRANPPREAKEALLAANKVADEVQHSKKRLDTLTRGNKEEKKLKLITQTEEAKEALVAATTGEDALKQAKKIVSNTEKIAKSDKQSFPRAASIIWQTHRSIVTVIIGFILACIIAIPVGILCGLNRIVMACLTPIISIFRPVSPVVWLLIFQIIIGAFFPDPENHPLLKFLNADSNPLGYFKTNPAMIFSACTVAMCALWPALVNTALGVSSIDPDHLNVAKVLRLGFWDRLFKIIIPSALPLIFAGLRISLGVGWMVLIAAEALSSSDGLGKFVWDEYQNGSSQSFANIILACFVVGIIGFFLDRIMIILQRFVSFDDAASV